MHSALHLAGTGKVAPAGADYGPQVTCGREAGKHGPLAVAPVGKAHRGVADFVHLQRRCEEDFRGDDALAVDEIDLEADGAGQDAPVGQSYGELLAAVAGRGEDRLAQSPGATRRTVSPDGRPRNSNPLGTTAKAISR